MLRLSVLLVVLLPQTFLLPSGTEVLGEYVSWIPWYPMGPAREGLESFQPEEEEGEYFEGDIILGPYKALNGDVKNLVADRSLLWPGGTLYYQLSNEFTETDKQWIRSAIADLQAATCVRFVESPGAGAYMLVRNTNGCAAPVGYYGIKTDMYLSSTGCRSWGTIQHEFLHALGFWHEHTRPDRDYHVQIMWQNIRPGRAGNFLARTPLESQYEGMPYDYGSVMHYRAVAFSRDGGPTIVPLQPGAQIGQRVRYSMIDLAKLNRLYGCGAGYYLGKGMYEGGEELEKGEEANKGGEEEVTEDKKEKGEGEEEEKKKAGAKEEEEEKKKKAGSKGEEKEVTEEEVGGKAEEKEVEKKRGEEVKDSISQPGENEKKIKTEGSVEESAMANRSKDEGNRK